MSDVVKKEVKLQSKIDGVLTELVVRTEAASVYVDETTTVADKFTAIKPSFVEGTLLASGWDAVNKTYSFEATYPNASYNIEIYPHKSCTEEQLKAGSAAVMLSSIDTNVITAFGEVPTVDIPIFIKVEAK